MTLDLKPKIAAALEALASAKGLSVEDYLEQLVEKELPLRRSPGDGPGHERGIVFQNYFAASVDDCHRNIRLAVDQVYPAWTAEKRKEHTEKYITMVKLTPAANKRRGNCQAA